MLGTDECMKVYQNFDVSSKVIAEIKKLRLARSRIKIEKEERIRKEQEVKGERLRKEWREWLIRQEEKEERCSKEQRER